LNQEQQMISRASQVPDPPAESEDTRARLLEVAGQLFAEAGYQKTTIREICRRAGANVAAVNYHFGGKLDLYSEVVGSVLGWAKQFAGREPAGGPEDQIRFFVRTYVYGLLGSGMPAWGPRLIMREMVQPGPVLQQLANDIARPLERRMRMAVAALTGWPADDDRVRLCVHSLVGQCLHYQHARAVLQELWPDLWRKPGRIDQVAEHISVFTLAGIGGLGSKSKERPKRRRSGLNTAR
jgi:AcrR family transcriptional regulator